MKWILLFLIVLGVCPSCSKGLKDIPLEEYNSYIQGYFDIENISVLERFNFSVDEEHKIINQSTFDNIFYIGNEGKSYSINDGVFLSIDIFSDLISDKEGLTPESRKRYEELRDDLGDTSFKRTLPINTPLPIALTESIEKICITVNQDYTQEYKKGSDVSNLFTLVYEYPFAVVMNRYRSPANAYRYEYTHPDLPAAVYKESLAVAKYAGKRALGTNFCLILNYPPDKSGIYSFTVTVISASGKTLTFTTKGIPLSV